MSLFLKLENLAMLLLTGYVYFGVFHLSLWVLAVCLFLPDLSMVGYLAGNRVGAITYNSVHNLIVPGVLVFIGVSTMNDILNSIGLILFIHIFMDRSLGYGLKYSDEFKHTHLG